MELPVDPSLAGKPYMPVNAVEGEAFSEAFCNRCKHLAGENVVSCDIEVAAIFYDAGEDGYPKEWIYDADGKPRCTAFEPVDE